MEDIYNSNTYLLNNPNWHQEDAPFKANKIIELLQRNPIAIKTIADLGCGSGEILVQLESKLKNATHFFGFDISKDAIQIAKKKETHKIKFELKNTADKDENGIYDLQLVIDVIEHIDNYFKFLTEISAKSHYTVFHIPLDISVWSIFREKMLIESYDRVGHIHNFTEDFITNVLANYGFEIVDKIYTEPTFEVVSSKQKVINFIRNTTFRINKKFCTKFFGGYSVLILTKNKTK